MKVVSLGAGAIGGYFGGRLVEGGCDVTFLVREGRKAVLQKSGLHIESQFGNFSGTVTAATREEISAPADLVLLTCKSYDLASAIEAIRPAVGPRTVILPLLNGISHIDDLNRVFGGRAPTWRLREDRRDDVAERHDQASQRLAFHHVR
jgi:2-dehydropantoate 2-reductase